MNIEKIKKALLKIRPSRGSCAGCEHKGTCLYTGCKIINEAVGTLDELQEELRSEMHRHDRLQDFEVAEAQELEFYKKATVDLRKQWQDAEALICTICAHCEYENHGGLLCVQRGCGEVVGYPCCGKFAPRERWIPVTERLPELKLCGAGTAYSEAVNVLTSGRKVLTAIWDGTDFISDAEFWEAEGETITHWTPVLLPLP